MPISKETQNKIEEIIHSIILNIPVLKREYFKLKKEWKFDNDFDFLYGSIVGQILGTVLTSFKFDKNRHATDEEMMIIGEIIESYFPLIRDAISQENR